MRLNAEMNKALAAPDVRQRMLDAGIEPAGGTPQQFRGLHPVGDGEVGEGR